MNATTDTFQVNDESPYTLADYDRMYTEDESCDKEDFAEKRSNVLLRAGEHYNKKRLNLYRKLRDFNDISSEHRLRITKNHIQNICNIYTNNILSMAPGVGFSPKNEKEMQDQKDTELYKSLWADAKEKYSISEKIDDWCDAMVGISEVAVKIFYDPLSSITGKRFVFENIFGFNLLRPPECKDMREASRLTIRKMVSIYDIKSIFGGDPAKDRMIVGSSDETMKVFDANRGGFRNAENELMLRETYFRPCSKYPEGWYAYVVKGGVLAEGPLPFGVFPIVHACFDHAPTSARGIGPIRTMRPYQVEINRCSSKIAETQTTLGDDKVILSNGAKFSPTAAFPGIRAFGATGGSAPVVLQGRSGEQYVGHLQNTITELYQVMNVAEDGMESQSNAQLDAYSLLFKSAKQKKKFKRYVGRFERFLFDVARVYLTLAKKSLTDEELALALGRDEIDNIAEIRNSSDINCQIIIEGQSDDIDTKMGKQLMINHALQYVGPQMKPDDIGKLLRISPIGSYEGMFSDMTQKYDNLCNDILSLDRGERPPIHPGDEHAYMSAGLNSRMRKADFKHLPAQVRMNYQAKIMLHDKFEAYKQLQLQRAKDGYIPTGGYLVVCDLYVPSPTKGDPEKTQRARVPYEALSWLIKQLEAQNMGQAELNQMDSSQQLGVMEQLNQARASQSQQNVQAV
jgi:hypothetical protein